MKRAHIEAEGHIIRKPLLEFGDDPQGMDGILGISISLFDPQSSLRSKCREEAFDVGCKHERTDEVSESSQAGGDISENLDSREVEVIDIRSRGIDVDDTRGSRMIPDRGVILNGIVAHCDDDIRRSQQFVSRRIVQLSNTSGKALEKIGGDSSCSLEGADDGQSGLTKKRPNGICVLRSAGQQAQQEHGPLRTIDELCGIYQRLTTGGPEARVRGNIEGLAFCISLHDVLR